MEIEEKAMRKDDDLSEELRKGHQPVYTTKETGHPVHRIPRIRSSDNKFEEEVPRMMMSASNELKRGATTAAGTTERDPLETIVENIKTRGMPALLPVECCIYKVPSRFRKGNEEFFKPWVVPIGPYHYGDGSFENVKIYKVKYMESFLKRSGQNLTQCLKVVRSWEAKARRYYAERVQMSCDEFALMILLDATFVLELMLRHQFLEYRDPDDQIYQKPRMIEDIYHDFILIENQLPLFVLEKFYTPVSRVMSSQGIQLSFPRLIHDFFKHFVKIDEFDEAAAVSAVRQIQVKNFLDFIRCYYLPRSASPSSQIQLDDQKDDGDNKVNEVGKITQTISKDQISPSLTALDEAGVQFETTTTTSITSLLDIQFNDGRLNIPQFTVDGWTETLFRNLIAFEQCHHTQDQYISHYMFLMACMIKSSKDMDLLIDHQIVVSGNSNMRHNMLGSSLFNHIGKGISLRSSQHYYYSSLCENLSAYCKSTPRRQRWKEIPELDLKGEFNVNSPWKETSKRDATREYYIKSPWKVAALLLLLLNFVQFNCLLQICYRA